MRWRDDLCFMGTVRPKSKEGNTTNLKFSFTVKNEKKLLRWDSNLRHTAYETDVLYPLNYRGSSAGWAKSRQYKAKTTILT